jgi:hypothetical protein
MRLADPRSVCGISAVAEMQAREGGGGMEGALPAMQPLQSTAAITTHAVVRIKNAQE